MIFDSTKKKKIVYWNVMQHISDIHTVIFLKMTIIRFYEEANINEEAEAERELYNFKIKNKK